MHPCAILRFVADAAASQQLPLVSVIIPAYKAAQSIPATLDSVFAQTFRNFEIIVVNDGSPDTLELETALEPYRTRITYFRQENQGPAGARNTGIRAARGEFVALLDSDDLWEPEHLEAQLAVLQRDPSIDMVYADARIFGDVPSAGRTVMDFWPSKGEVTFESLVMRVCTVHICVSMVRRQTLLDIGLFDLAFRGTEDIDMWLRIVQHGGRIAYQRRVLGRYRKQAGSLSSDPIPMIEGFLAVLAKAAQDPKMTPAELQAIERQCAIQRAQLALEQGRKAFLAGDTDAAVANLTRANAHFRSARLTAILLLLKLAPRLMQSLYHWRDRHIYKLKTQP